MHWLRHTPWSVHVRSLVVHSAGTYSLPFWMIGSGTHRPALPASAHETNALSSEGGMALVGAQCEGPYLQQLAPGRVDGSRPG